MPKKVEKKYFEIPRLVLHLVKATDMAFRLKENSIENAELTHQKVHFTRFSYIKIKNTY